MSKGAKKKTTPWLRGKPGKKVTERPQIGPLSERMARNEGRAKLLEQMGIRSGSRHTTSSLLSGLDILRRVFAANSPYTVTVYNEETGMIGTHSSENPSA